MRGIDSRPDGIGAVDLVDGRAAGEPSLREIWAMVATRWRTIVVIAALIAAASAVGALVHRPRFVYSSAIEIGVITERIEPAEAVAAKLQETYLPLIRDEYARAHPEQARAIPTFDVRVPRGGGLVVVESRGTRAAAPMHEALHGAAVAMIEVDHARVIAIKREALEAAQLEARRRAQEQDAQIDLFRAGLARIDATERLLQSQRAALRETLTQAQSDRAVTLKTRGDRDAPALLIIDQEILRAQERLAALDERLAVGLRSERTSLTKSIGDAERLRAAQMQTIDQARNELANLRPTRALTRARTWGLPVDPSAFAILGLGSAAGLLLAVVVAIVAGLIERGHVRVPSRV